VHAQPNLSKYIWSSVKLNIHMCHNEVRSGKANWRCFTMWKIVCRSWTMVKTKASEPLWTVAWFNNISDKMRSYYKIWIVYYVQLLSTTSALVISIGLPSIPVTIVTVPSMSQHCCILHTTPQQHTPIPVHIPWIVQAHSSLPSNSTCVLVCFYASSRTCILVIS
jgi:hypothetical protein